MAEGAQQPILVGRDEEIALLTCLLSADALQGRAVYVFGNSATGKTSVVRQVVAGLAAASGARSAYLNATEVSFTSPRRLYEILLAKLAAHQLCAANHYTCELACETAAGFCQHVAALHRSDGGGRAAPLYIMLDHAERLRHIDGALNTLMRLPELTGAPVCVVLISTVVWDCLQGFCAVPNPVQVHFKNYTRDIFQQILLASPSPPPSSHPELAELWDAFVFVFTETYASVCNDLNELKYIAASLFPVFLNPVVCGEVSKDDTTKLMDVCRAPFKAAFESLYLHETKETVSEEGAGAAVLHALPLYAKYMLIAGYLASYLPPRLDLKNFTQLERRRVSKNQLSGDEANVEPKAFTADRLLAVFAAMLKNEKVESGALPDSCLQVSSLVALALFVKVSSDINLHLVRYKCIAEPTLVEAVGKSVDIDVKKYF